jgi:methyltransferase (TIGR00027 family)
VIGASRTAVLVAGYRARASAREGAIISDPWAAALAGDEGRSLTERFDAPQPHLELWIAVRTAHLDARVRHLTGEPGIRQVVILGAGLDTRAARLAAKGVSFFEVDHPETQKEKLSRLARLEGYPARAATYVACDFADPEADFVSLLDAEGFDLSAPAVILWEGVTPYLEEDAVRGTVSRIASGCHPQSVLLFDFLGKNAHRRGRGDEADEDTRDAVEDLGEPLRFGTNDIIPLLYDCGMRRVHVRGFDELGLEYTGTYERARKWRFQYLAETSVASAQKAHEALR